MVDKILEHAPDVIKSSYSKLLPCTIDQLCVKDSQNKDAKLSSGLSEEIKGSEWRIIVLERLRRILAVVHDAIVSSDTKSGESVQRTLEGQGLYPLKRYHARGVSLQVLSQRLRKEGNMGKLSKFTFATFAGQVMPLLMDACCESLQDDSGQKKRSQILSADEQRFMEEVAYIIYFLVGLVKDEVRLIKLFLSSKI